MSGLTFFKRVSRLWLSKVETTLFVTKQTIPLQVKISLKHMANNHFLFLDQNTGYINTPNIKVSVIILKEHQKRLQMLPTTLKRIILKEYFFYLIKEGIYTLQGENQRHL